MLKINNFILKYIKGDKINEEKNIMVGCNVWFVKWWIFGVRAEDAKISPPPPRGVHVRGEFCSCKCECCAKCEKCAKMKRPERPRPPQRNEAKKAIDKAL